MCYKIAEPGTKYMSAEGPATLQEGSVLRIDGQGRPYQSTVEFMFKKVQLTPEQMAELVKVDPVQAASTKAGIAYMAENNPELLFELNPDGMASSGRMPRLDHDMYHYTDPHAYLQENYPMMTKYLDSKGIKVVEYEEGGVPYDIGHVDYITADGVKHTYSVHGTRRLPFQEFLDLVVKGELEQ